MGKLIGIWINNRKAQIVSLEKGQEHHETHESLATRHVRLPGESKGMTQPNESDSKYREDLRGYFKDVFEIIKEAEAIFIFGPGKAKENLKKALKEAGEPVGKIVGMETADKMTENQIVARIKEFFRTVRPAEKAMELK
jgi:stalled ribosome rescue protein Dom34